MPTTLPDKFQSTITSEDIAEGRCADAFHCAASRSVRRTLGLHYKVGVAGTHIKVEEEGKVIAIYRAEDTLARWLEGFDRNPAAARPFHFRAYKTLPKGA